LIDVKNISKSFNGREVLKNISATFEPGKCSLIIGTSGSGKTVMMKCVVGLFKVDKGSILYDGSVDMTSLDKKDLKLLRQQVGMLFQGTALFDSMNVESNVIFPLDMFSKMTMKEKMKRVDECLERVNLKGSNKLLPNELSGGMKKRVGIARAIVMNPKYLFCDEPNSGLDPQTSTVIDSLIQEITREYQMTTIINTHDMNSVMEIGDHIIFIYKGEKNWEGNNKQILSTTNKELNDFIFASKFLKALKINNAGN
jgi:phospholipid/cholesterol/gamma-HCH transport system ATP-binding protein